MPPTLSWIEVVWIAGGLLAVPLTIRSLIRAMRNRRAVRAAAAARAARGRPPLPPGYGASAALDVRWRAVALWVQLVMLGIGVRAGAYPPAAPGGVTWDTVLMGICILAMQAALVWVAVATDVTEGRLWRDYRRDPRQGRAGPPPDGGSA